MKQRLNFKAKFDAEKDIIVLDVKINKSLQAVLKDFCVLSDTTDFNTYNGVMLRYLVRRILTAELPSQCYALFCVGLVDVGVESFEFDSTERLKEFIDNLRDGVRVALELHPVLKLDKRISVSFKKEGKQ